MLIGAILTLTWLILVIRQPAKALPISLVAVLGIGLVAAWVLWEERVVDRQLALLDVRVAYAPTRARRPPAADPRAQRQQHHLLDLAWVIQAYRPGDAINLTQSAFDAERSLGPPRLQAGADWSHCLPVPPLRSGYRPQTLEFRAERLHGRFAD